MKSRTSIVAAALLLTSTLAVATTPDNSKTYTATIDPPVGTIRCGFSVSGTVKAPVPGFLTYGLFFRSEANIVTALNQRQPVTSNYFKTPGTVRITGNSKDVGNDQLFQNRKTIQLQLRVWWTSHVDGPVAGGGPQSPPLAESQWIDVPLSSQPCATTKPLTGLASPTSSAPAVIKH